MAIHPRYTALRLERSGRWTAAAVGLVMFAIYLGPTFLSSRISDEHPIEAGTTVTVNGFRYVRSRPGARCAASRGRASSAPSPTAPPRWR